MEELDELKEKARAYDEALERASKLRVQNPFDTVSQMMEYVFPELKESEDDDEAVRKELIDAIHGLWDNDALPIPLTVKRKDNWLSWIEKQSEQTNLPKFTFDDVLALQCCMEIVKEVQEDKDLYEKLNDIHGRVYDAYQIEKQGKQKPIFNADDWELVEQNSTCSKEEDENKIEDIIYFLNAAKTHYASTEAIDDCVVWLESLRLRKQWSEEDKEMFDCALDMIEWYSGKNENRVRLVSNWLKSIKQKIEWKPTKEQMKALHDLNLVGNISYVGQGQLLIELYNDLMKLIE